MYLVCSSKTYFKELSGKSDSEIAHLPLIKTSLITDNYQHLKEIISNFTYILLVSPTAIKFCADLLGQISKNQLSNLHLNKSSNQPLPKLLTVGVSSYQKLKKLVPDLEAQIIYPKHSSGIEALVNECLKEHGVNDKPILVIRGDNTKADNLEPLYQLGQPLKIIEIYHKSYEPNSLEIKKMLQYGKTQGIIATSSALAQRLVDIIKINNLEWLLENINFIAIHHKIAKKLTVLGAHHVHVTKDATKSSLIKLLRDIS